MALPQQAQVVVVEFLEGDAHPHTDPHLRECYYLLTFPLGEEPPKIIDPKKLTRLYPVARYDGRGSMYVRQDVS